MPLLVDQLVAQLDLLKNVVFPGKLVLGGPHPYHVKQEWNTQIPEAESNGIYIYTTVGKEVLYIGKGEYSSGGGIGNRSCAHLGRAVRNSEEMFPNHQWAKDGTVDETISNLLLRGDFLLWTLRVEPAHFVSLVEVYLQTVYEDSCRTRPMLNKRIG
jgi:hypothetical protein